VARLFACNSSGSMPNIYRAEARLSPGQVVDGGVWKWLSSKWVVDLLHWLRITVSWRRFDRHYGIEVLKSRAFLCRFCDKYPVMVI